MEFNNIKNVIKQINRMIIYLFTLEIRSSRLLHLFDHRFFQKIIIFDEVFFSMLFF